jgi:hypothetical protein
MRYLVFAVAALLLAVPALAQTPSRVRLGWDDGYLYAAFDVVDSDVRGSNEKPFSNPLEDDAVGFYVRTGRGAGSQPDGASRALLVSAVGGMSFLKGESGAWTTERKFTMKIGVHVEGTVNRSDDKDRGYSVELAIPWTLLGLDGKSVGPATVLSACVLTRKRGGAILPFPAGADINEPSTWPPLRLGEGEGGLRAFSLVAPPTIDGRIGDAEWRSDGIMLPGEEDSPTALDPTVPLLLTPLPGIADTAPSLVGVKPENITGRVFARYVPFFQADLAKAYPVRGVLSEGGSYLLVDQPESGLGPWFSTDRVGWHKENLTAMKRVGIDAALAQVGGPDAPTALVDDKTLLTLVTALRELSVEKAPAPTLTPLFDSAYLAPTARKVDLSVSAGREHLWRAIRRWMTLVAPELRTRVVLPGGQSAYPIFFTDAAGIENAQASGWADDLRRRFAQEFGLLSGGATLIFVGGKGFPLSENVVGALPAGAGKGVGTLPLCVVSPGSQTPLVPRKSGATYRTRWDEAIQSKASWLVIDSWNDFAAASEIAPSRQHGSTYLDDTRIQLVRTFSNRDWGVRLLATDLPGTLKGAELFPARITLQSIGLTPLRGTSAPTLSYRWVQAGKTIAKSPLAIRPTLTLFATQSATVPFGIATFDDASAALKPGAYTLVIEATSPDGKLADSLSVPVRIDTHRPDAVEFQSTTTPALLQSGASYPTTLRLRWLGANPLVGGEARLLYQILSADGKSVLRSDAIALDTTLAPGAWTTVRATLRTTDSSGAPLKPAMPENSPQIYDENALGVRIRWALARSAGDPVPGGYEESVAIYPGDDEAQVVLDSFVETGGASAIHPAQLSIVNRGPFSWSKGQYAVAVRFCYADGFTYRRQEEGHTRTPIVPPTIGRPFDSDVAPGQSISALLNVRLPDRAGRYVAVFSVVRITPQGPVFLDGGIVTRTGDIAQSTVDVTGGRLAPLDLEKLFDTDGAATEAEPADGNLDGKGATLPAEWLAPDRFGRNRAIPGTPAILYPSGYYADITSGAARGASFRYGPTTKGAKNALAARGQTLPIEKGRYYALHLVAVATGGQSAPLTLTLKYADGKTEEQKLTVADWLKPLAPNEAIALAVPRKRTPQGDRLETPALRHYIVPVSVQKELIGVQLGHQDQVKIFAVTLER